MERNLTLIALFAALIAALGLVPKLTLAFGVPISAQSLGPMLCGVMLGARRGALAALLFVVLVLLGLPLLAGGRGGLGVVLSPTTGFFLGFPVAAFVTGAVMERLPLRSIVLSAAIAACIGGIGALYVCGIAGMAWALDKSLAEATMLAAVFVPGDLLKAGLAGILTASLARARPGSLLSRP